ncbi:hypothetical protein [Cellulomonas sp. P5_E12]
MEQRLKVRLVGVLVAVLGAVVLSGCASNTPIEDFAGLPQVPAAATDETADDAADEEAAMEELDVPEGETRAVYLDNGDRIAVVLWGSSTCPPVGSRLVVVTDANSGNEVRLEVAEIPADAVCTADLVPHTTVFGTPQQTTTTLPLLIDVNGEQVVLPVK